MELARKYGLAALCCLLITASSVAVSRPVTIAAIQGAEGPCFHKSSEGTAACLEPLTKAELAALEQECSLDLTDPLLARAATCSSAQECFTLGEQFRTEPCGGEQRPLVPLERAVALDPGSAMVNKALASAYMGSFGCIGGMNLHLIEREVCLAEIACRTALAVTPDDADALLLLGEILTAEVNWGYRTDDAAVEPLKKAIELRPDWPEAYCSLGNAYRLLKRYEPAVAAFTVEAETRDKIEHSAEPKSSPENLEPWQHHLVGDAYTLAEMCNKMGRFNEALRWLLPAERIDPEDIVIHLWAGKTYLSLGDIESAKRERQLIAGLRLCSDRFLGYQCTAYGKSLQEAIEATAK